MNWLKRLFGKRKSAAEQENTPTPATPAAEKPAEPATTESVSEPAGIDTASEAAGVDSVSDAAGVDSVREAAAGDPVSEAADEPATEPEPAPVAAGAPEEASDPAINVLDDVERSAELQTATPETAAQPVPEGPYGPASAKPASDGAAPSAEFTIKGKESSKLFHTEESPYFGRTKADVWFKSAADAESAGFTAYTRKKATAKK